MQTIDIAFITDKGFLEKSIVAIASLGKSALANSHYHVHLIVVDTENTPKITKVLNSIATENLEFSVIEASVKHLDSAHVFNDDTICSATLAGLLKFQLPTLLPMLDKVLYLDGDIIVRKDLSELYNTDISSSYAAVVQEAGSLFWDYWCYEQVDRYFNSGVMLLNLAEMRLSNAEQKLFETKSKIRNDSSIMDQNAFNLVFDKRVVFLPIKWNCCFVGLEKSINECPIELINKEYGTTYRSLVDCREDAAIIHYASKRKPWKDASTPVGKLWIDQAQDPIVQKALSKLKEPEAKQNFIEETLNQPCVSVIIPVYNTHSYLEESIRSITNQTLQDIEIICIDDGSTDGSSELLDSLGAEDNRIAIIHRENRGQSSARNLGLKRARGKYIYFFDSDDILENDALESLFSFCETNNDDLLTFDGKSFYEDESLSKKFPEFADRYSRKHTYQSHISGEDMYVRMHDNGEFLVSPCLIFSSRELCSSINELFYEGIVHEDNLSTLKLFLAAKRVSHIPIQYFKRRIRHNSTMTSRTNISNYISFYTLTVSILKIVYVGNYNECTVRKISGSAMYFARSTFSSYRSLPNSEKIELFFEDRTEMLISSVLYASLISGCLFGPKDIKLETRKAERKVKQSRSYRLGHKLLYFPRKIKKLYKRLLVKAL